MIKLKDISVGYTGTLLQANNIELHAGKVYVLIGVNGAGKTTLFNSIIGQQSLINGEILINGIPVSEMSALDVAKNIAFVPANFPLVDYMRVIDFIGLGRSPYTSFFGRLSKRDQEIIDETMELLGIDTLKNCFVNELSDGQRQLVSIAKAMAQDTPVIILDEPLAYLDFSNRRALLRKLNQLASESKKCIVFSSHDIDVSTSEQFGFLLIDAKSRKVQLFDSPSRDQIIQTCFPD